MNLLSTYLKSIVSLLGGGAATSVVGLSQHDQKLTLIVGAISVLHALAVALAKNKTAAPVAKYVEGASDTVLDAVLAASDKPTP